MPKQNAFRRIVNRARKTIAPQNDDGEDDEAPENGEKKKVKKIVTARHWTRSVLVTGADRGIGLALVKQLAATECSLIFAACVEPDANEVQVFCFLLFLFHFFLYLQ
jgi:hypothetical protein